MEREKEAARALLAWFRTHARRMDWRETGDPYRIWVSEIMLQQTRVGAVTPYYRRFLRKFPTVEAAARAPQDAILKIWEGLGYYARARNLHKAARIVVAVHGGRLPDSVGELAKLPGIGRTTAGAIAALAFRRDEPILDANVKRVLARLHAIREDVRKASAERKLWECSRRMILPAKGRETALALMDLGSTVCTPKAPRCPVCPLAAWCVARRRGIQESIPRQANRKSVPHRDRAVAVVRDRTGKILLRRRPELGLLGGLWELPGCIVPSGEAGVSALAGTLRGEAGIEFGGLRRIGDLRQGYSHFRETIHGFRCRKTGGKTRSETGWKWAAQAELAKIAMPRADRKLLEMERSGRREETGP